MRREITGRVIQKDFRPRTNEPPEDMCYLLIENGNGKRTTVHLHRRRVKEVFIGDHVHLRTPSWPQTAVSDIEIIRSDRETP